MLFRSTANIRDAKKHPHFNGEVDEELKFKTRTILCMPIYNSDGDVRYIVHLNLVYDIFVNIVYKYKYNLSNIRRARDIATSGTTQSEFSF